MVTACAAPQPLMILFELDGSVEELSCRVMLEDDSRASHQLKRSASARPDGKDILYIA